jgi:hypothetical protein
LGESKSQKLPIAPVIANIFDTGSKIPFKNMDLQGFLQWNQ